MTDEPPEDPGAVPEEGPDIPEKELPEEKMGLGFYAAFGLVLLLVLIIVVGNYSVIRPDAGTELTRTNWTLQYLKDKTGITIPVQTGSRVTAQFGKDGRVSGYSGCNWYASTYTTKDRSITTTPESVTDMLCWGPGVMDQESAYLADLSAVASWRTGGSDLFLADASGRTVLVFNPE
jgi:heat shock protein HslJ